MTTQATATRATTQVKPVPDGHHTLTPYLYVKGAERAMDFYARAFGAREIFHLGGDGGRVMHAELRVGDSVLMLCDEDPSRGMNAPSGTERRPASVMVYLPDVDEVFARAVENGATALRPPADMFWGDRFCSLRDPFGHEWSVATHVEDVPPEEMQRRLAAGCAASSA